MRILHVAESVKGGCGTYLDQLVGAQLADSAIQNVHAIVPDAHVSQLANIPLERLTLFRSQGRSPASLMALWRAVQQVTQTFRPDCVHLHSTFAGAIGRLGFASRRPRPSIVYCAHGWAFDMEGSAARRTIMASAERALAFGCEGIIAISGHERRRAIEVGIAPERIVTVLNGIVDLPPPPPPRPGSVRKVLFIGRLDRQKGIDVLLSAIDGLHDRVSLRIIGASVVGDQALTHSPRAGVDLLGWCDEAGIQEELAWADCVVVPSRWEGFGLVAVEAMRAGRAVIASKAGGLPEVIEDGVTGWLVRPEDPAELRSVLLSLSHAQLVDAGAAGRQRFVRRFTIDRTTTALNAVYTQAIAMRSSISHALPHAASAQAAG
ncbi:glycosyltransferase [Novosphingobium sp. RD2P27]|uniref:Glycosyltransferase n=1 Tax=Novosphingobium kalidii TaxID=3230299 RepID=A0ABV2CXT5_9SPHN